MDGFAMLLTLCLACTAPAALAQTTSEDDHSAHHPAAGTPAESAAPAEHDHNAGKPDPA
jgi:hypothetical protein